jgi:two-component system sensor histidine kinase TctE
MTALRSLRGQLLIWLLGPLLCVTAFNAWSGYLNAQAIAGQITDRMLLASASAIAEQVKAGDGVVEALIPPSALEIFATDDNDHVAYAVTGPDGTLLAGDADLASLAAQPSGLQPLYANPVFRKQPMRSVALRQKLASDDPSQTALVVVGETLQSYHRIAGDIWRRNCMQQLGLVAIAGGLTWFGLNRGLRPLTRLGSALLEREPYGLEPLPASGLQTELQPVVSALNEALARVRHQIANQRRFIADAAHQLRTPLTLLKTQASVGSREDDIHAAREALGAVVSTTDALTRLTNQLLTLARTEADHVSAVYAPVDLMGLVHQVIDQFARRAIANRIEIGFASNGSDVRIRGEPTLLRELVVNLLDNALKYTPENGEVTVDLACSGDTVVLRVGDTGIGIPVAEQARVFERFYRVLGTGVEGSGLGLAIVAEVVRLHLGQVSLFNRADSPGLCVEVRFPAMQPQAAAA